MTWTEIANLKGNKGDKGNAGDRGPQGLAGAESVPADTAVASYLGTEGDSLSKTAAAKNFQRTVAVDIRVHGAVDGAANNTTAIQAAATAAAGGVLVIPPGLWITDPISLESDTTVEVYGTMRLRGQDVANLPSSCGVLYAYGTATARKTNVKIHGFGGKIDGNRRGMTNLAAFSFDQECVNFKYMDNGEIIGLEVFDAIESGIDLDMSTACIVRGNVAHDCYGNGVHMSNGAIDNLVEGNTAVNNGFGNSRQGFDQYAGSTPQANRNRYIGNRAIGNYRNFNIAGELAIFSGNSSLTGTNPDILTADMTTLDPKAPMYAPARPNHVGMPSTAGAVQDVEARAVLAQVRAQLITLGVFQGGSGDSLVASVSDSFNRTSAGGLGTSSGGATWSPETGTYEVVGQAAKRLASSTGIGCAYLPGIGSTNFRVEARIRTGSTRTAAGFAFRSTTNPVSGVGSADFLIVDIGRGLSSENGVRIRERSVTAGTTTTLASNSAVTLNANTDYVLEARVIADTIVAYLDGAPVVTHVLSASMYAKYGRNGYVALYSNVSGTQDDGQTTWDAFYVRPV